MALNNKLVIPLSFNRLKRTIFRRIIKTTLPNKHLAVIDEGDEGEVAHISAQAKAIPGALTPLAKRFEVLINSEKSGRYGKLSSLSSDKGSPQNLVHEGHWPTTLRHLKNCHVAKNKRVLRKVKA